MFPATFWANQTRSNIFPGEDSGYTYFVVPSGITSIKNLMLTGCGGNGSSVSGGVNGTVAAGAGGGGGAFFSAANLIVQYGDMVYIQRGTAAGTGLYQRLFFSQIKITRNSQVIVNVKANNGADASGLVGASGGTVDIITWPTGVTYTSNPGGDGADSYSRLHGYFDIGAPAWELSGGGGGGSGTSDGPGQAGVSPANGVGGQGGLDGSGNSSGFPLPAGDYYSVGGGAQGSSYSQLSSGTPSGEARFSL